MRRAVTDVTEVAVLAIMLLLVACGGSGAGSAGPAGEAVDPEPVRYDCFGVTVTADELESAPSVADLDDHPGVGAFEAATGDLGEWSAVLVEDDELGAIRAIDPPDVLDGEVRDHERLVVEHIGDAGAGEVDDDGWMTTSAGPCTLRAELGELGPVTVLLDPEALPTRGDASLSLWVVERACASGQPATDRVVLSVEETVDEVRVVAGVQPLGGDQTCPSNPATPVSVELDDPIGERRLVDAARLPVIELEEAPADLRVEP